MEKKMDRDFWKSKNGRWAIIGITYLTAFLVMWILSQIASRSEAAVNITMAMVLACAVLALPTANKAVNYVNHAIFGNLILFGPLQMFLQIFLIKLVLRVAIALFGGIVIAPYTLGNFVAKQIRKMQ
jgi:ABC-type Mn2+/Zn2+ transport system permease subunit